MAAPALAKPAPKKAPARKPVQAKMSVGAANDRFEQEADRIASRMGKSESASAPPPTISGLGGVQRKALPAKAGPEKKAGEIPKPPEQRTQRKAAPGKPAPPAVEELAKPPEKRSQRKESPAKTPRKGSAKPPAKAPGSQPPKKAARAQRDAKPEPVGHEGGDVPRNVERKIDSLRARPAPGIEPGLKSQVESAVGSDLSGARVHRGAEAAQAAGALGARAFTVGNDMFFGPGEYKPQTSAGQQLIAHEAAHTVQQGGGSAQAKRVVRMKKDDDKKPKKQAAKGSKKKKKKEQAEPETKVPELGDANAHWKISNTSEFKNAKGTLMVPKLELPRVAMKLKGEANDPLGPKAIEGIELPVENATFKRRPREDRDFREDGAAYEKWVKFIRENGKKPIAAKLDQLMKDQAKLGAKKAPAPIVQKGNKTDTYVLKRKFAKDKLDTVVIGTLDQLSENDNIVRPMISRVDGDFKLLDADHILEDQLGGEDSAANMWLLDRSVNRSYGSQIKAKIDASIKDTLEKAVKKEEEDETEFAGKIPDDPAVVKTQWAIEFEKVVPGKFNKGDNPGVYWTRADVLAGEQVKFFKALNEGEMIEQGFPGKEGAKPARINVFPSREGGRAASFEVSTDGKSVTAPKGYWFRGIEILKVVNYDPKALEGSGSALIELEIQYTKKKDKKGKWKDENLISASKNVAVMHDPMLGFGGYMPRESITKAFEGAKFAPLCPISFTDMAISPEGDLMGSGTISSSVALLPDLKVPISLLGNDVFMSFPLPTAALKLGPVSVTDAALNMGVGENGFFISGVAGVAVDQVGKGTLFARAEKDDVLIGGEFELDMDFLSRASVKATYSLAKDDFVDSEFTLEVEKDTLPGVESGSVTVGFSRKAMSVSGTLNLGGILKGSVINVLYGPDTGLVLEAKDIPLPIGKLPGVSEAALTVKAVRDPAKGEWAISGGGKAKFGVAGAKGELDILYDGVATSFSGKAEVAKGPATGSLQIQGTNRAIDDKGNPIENGPVGDLKIWGKGEASIVFGSVLKGTAGIEYTPDGRVIISGEIAMPPTYPLFDKKDLSPKEPLFNFEPPSFPIWGVSLGPVDIGISAFVKATVRGEAWVGPGQLKDAKIAATMDLDKPEEAVVDGSATFFVPSYAGFDLYLGGGLKASVAVAYVKGDVGLYGKLGLGVDGSFGVNVHWSQAEGLAVGAEAKLEAKPKFELGIRASVTAGVSLPWPLPDLDHTWGPWEHELGKFGPDMALTATFPMGWSEAKGLDIDPSKIKIDPPKLDAKELMKSGFDALV